jgi:hypothetical protein
MYTLNVRNIAQKMLFDGELSGQISDGMWENSGPHGHWIPWCNAEIVVDPTNIGRDFYARKDNYNLNGKLLMEYVGDRMVEHVQTVIPDYDMKTMLADLRDLKKIMKVVR